MNNSTVLFTNCNSITHVDTNGHWVWVTLNVCIWAILKYKNDLLSFHKAGVLIMY